MRMTGRHRGLVHHEVGHQEDIVQGGVCQEKETAAARAQTDLQASGGCDDGVGRQGDHAARSLDEDGIIGIGPVHHEGGHLEEFVQGSFKSRR